MAKPLKRMHKKGKTIMFSKQEKANFSRYWKGVFKYIFFVLFGFTALRVALLFLYDDAENVTLFSILTGILIIGVGSVLVSVLIALMAIFKER
nr:hypothetical protein [Pseudoalteromonas sp. 1701]